MIYTQMALRQLQSPFNEMMGKKLKHVSVPLRHIKNLIEQRVSAHLCFTSSLCVSVCHLFLPACPSVFYQPALIWILSGFTYIENRKIETEATQEVLAVLINSNWPVLPLSVMILCTLVEKVQERPSILL